MSTLTAVAIALSAGQAVADDATSPSRSARGTPSGTVTIAAEQELDCADWIASCAGSTWGA